ncbi:unnamed protein product [Lepeophtheirus salmonis]|uniref:(salmon louse) hypothetical protein n=1 Tax=Lepeophtheirus salmonis TaxID=72036 RepID=A0A7R8CNA5_LEPSM|nr:unnamed protein product [Lepeophtheirus salmonis]CAF2828151.1 unnamed protein product [Lepeophtheirus salmonis]
MKDLEPPFGSDAINYFANDDKARIPVGLAAANLQAPILISLRYKVRLLRMYDPSTSFTHAFDLRNHFISESIKRKPILVLETIGGSGYKSKLVPNELSLFLMTLFLRITKCQQKKKEEALRNVKPLHCSVNLF